MGVHLGGNGPVLWTSEVQQRDRARRSFILATMHRPVHFVLLAVALAACRVQGGVPAAEPRPEVDHRPRYHARKVACHDAATVLGDKVGTTVAIRCPAGCTDGSIWGTDVYTSDSALCVAAVHAGTASVADGGDVMIEIVAGQVTYQGSARHGVTSSSWGSWERSFRIESLTGGVAVDDQPVVDVEAQPPRTQLTCQQTAATLPGGAGTRHLLDCPPGCSAGSVWGSVIYTDDSAICVAAVHAGVATMIAGGAIAVTIFAGLPSYQASSSNGVTTASWGAWKRSFRVDRR